MKKVLFGALSAVFLLGTSIAGAATSNITQLVFTTTPQSIEENSVSAALTVQTQNASSTSESLDTPGTILELTSSSPTGEFSSNAVTWLAVTTVGMNNGTANRTVYYKDSTPGSHTLTFTAQGQTWTAAVQIITVTEAPSATIVGGGSYSTLQAAVNAASPGSTIELDTDMTLASQVTVGKQLTIDGNGHTLFASFAKTDNSNNSAIGVIDADGIVIKDIIFDGSAGTNLHGVNVYVSDNVHLDELTLSGFRAAVVVNGSAVTVHNINTSGNAWGGINVDLGSGVTSPAVLTVNGFSSHNEVGPDIWMDNITKPVSLVDTNQQYASTTVGNLRTYELDTEPPVITLIGDSQVSVFRTNGYVDEGATATDNVNSSVVVTDDSDTFNFQEVGTYTITYTATDTRGNTATLTRTVIVRPAGNGSGGSRGNSAGAASSQAAQATANAGVNLPAQAALVIGGEVLGASTVDLSAFVGQVLGASDVSVPILSAQALSALSSEEKQTYAANTKSVLVSKINELIGLLQAQLQSAQGQ